MSELVKAFANP
ncbi:hypothetical protein AZE42_10945, partial [Rhizopogon vesiculosus]